MTSAISYRETAGLEIQSLGVLSLPQTTANRTSEREWFGAFYRVSLDVRDHLELTARVRPTRKLRSEHQAILIGHMVRLFKLYDTFLLVVAAGRTEVAYMFYRFITETGIHLLFLIKRGNQDIFQSYRRASLAYEKKFLSKSRQWRDTPRLTNEEFAAIESLTKASFDRAGLKVDQVAEQECEWGGAQYKTTSAKATAIGAAASYEIGFRFGSQIVHGMWYDLEYFHLLRLPDGYEPNTTYRVPRWGILDIPTSFSLRVAFEYLVHIGCSDRRHPLLSRLAALSEWFVQLDAAHDEALRQSRKKKVH